jgi:hypothetical protein
MAESVVVADNIELVANNIQSKVGASLIGGKALAEDTKEVSEPSLGVLDGIRTLQQKTVDKVHAVWQILKSTLDLEKEQARRAREGKGEAELEAGGDEGESGAKKAGKGLGAQLMEKFKAMGPQLFTLAGLMSIATLIFKSALIFMIAGFLGDAIIDYFNIESEAAKTALTFALPTMAVLMPLLIPLIGITPFLVAVVGALIGMGFASVISWIKGDKMASELTGFDWGSIALTGPALMYLAKVGWAGKAGTLFGLAVGWPVLIGGALAIAFAAGIGYLFTKVKSTEQKMLDHLGEMTDLSQAEFEKRLKEQKTGFLAKFSPGLAATFGLETTQLQDAYMATEAAKDRVNAGKDLKQPEISNLVKQVDMFANIDEDTLKALLDDKDKADELMRLIHSMYQVAQSGQLGEDSAKVIKKLAELSQNIQMTAKDMFTEKKEAGESTPGYLEDIATDSTKNNKGGDVFERYANLIANPRYQKLAKEKEDIEGDARYKELNADPQKLDRDERKELNEFNRKLQRVNTAMHYMKKDEMGSVGQIKMIDMLKLLTPAEQAQVLEQALSDKKTLLKATKKLIKDDEGKGGDTVISSSDNSSKVVTGDSITAVSTSGIFEVDYSLRKSLEQG